MTACPSAGRSGTRGRFRDTAVTLRAGAANLASVTSGMCPDCGHAWKVHPGGQISATACLECIIEEDHNAREFADMCSCVPPDLEQVPVGDVLVARHRRRLLRGDRVLVEDYKGGRWALLRPPTSGREQVERLIRQVREDLATMPITQFREKYRPFMD